MLSELDILRFRNQTDSYFQTLENKHKDEIRERKNLYQNITDKKNRISQIEQALATLSPGEKPNSSESVEKTKKYISDWWNTIIKASGISDYLSEAKHLSMIASATSHDVAFLKKVQEDAAVLIDRIKKHRNYKTWIKNADRLRFHRIEHLMPETLSGYSAEATDLIISYGAKILWEPYKRYMYYHLFLVFVEEIQLQKSRAETIDQFSIVNKKADQLIPDWIKALQSELKREQEALEKLETIRKTFDSDSDQRIKKKAADLEAQILRQRPPEKINTSLQKMKDENNAWEQISDKSGICTEGKERFILTYCSSKCKTIISKDAYVASSAQRLAERYHELLSVQGDSLVFRYPVLMHLDTLRFRMAVNIQGVQDRTRSAVNALAQRFVTSVISNMPVGKAKLVFCDPANTGVFSNFRDVGKNESEGSRLSTYIVDVDSIRKELDRLSEQIGYTINNILKGTKTTLYQHNKELSFNSSPYEFLFLMDYPQNMTAQSLQALKNIVDNGPKCGIFTIIFNIGGTAMQLLRKEEQQLAEEIAKSDYELKGRQICGPAESWLDEESEVSTSQFDNFVEIYNEAIKDSRQLTVYLDELEGKVYENGEYKIPIGKNLGGETEYMSFFGSCQDYLMSGATRIGKTNALHVIVYNTLKYIPNAELYLVDFKQGVEFAPYAKLNHPVIKALAVESVPEFGYAVLRHIEDKIKAIGELFISCGVRNWKEYYSKTGKVIPVTIVIIDEFQHLFDTDVGKECARIIEVITKEGGAFNVHVILATQSVSSVVGLTEPAKMNIFGRMAFYHSDKEYSAMLWNDTHLALTLRDNVKGQMVFSTGDKNSQRLLQWAIAKPVGTVVAELSKPIEQGRYETKLLLSTIRENPYSVFNAIINEKYTVEDKDVCEITIGNEVNVFSGELRRQLESGVPQKTKKYIEKSYLRLTHRANENLIFVGNNESIAESCFQLSIYCVLARQIALGREKSIVVLAPDLATRITAICKSFPDYILCFDQEADLSTLSLDGLEFMFVFGLQNFRSLSYQPDMPDYFDQSELSGASSARGYSPFRQMGYSPMRDGLIFRAAVESEDIHVIAWHNSIQNLAEMFGGVVKVQDFLYRFLHKVAFRMTNKEESRQFINSESCAELSEKAAIYVKMNKERIIRPYKAMDDEYCKQLNEALEKLKGGNNK